MIVIKVQSSKGKLNVSTETDLKQNQGFDLAVKLRAVIGFKHNPNSFDSQKTFSLQVSLADYVGSYHTKSKQAFRYKHIFQYINVTTKAIRSIQDVMMHARTTRPHNPK
jgi:hypothetical protein